MNTVKEFLKAAIVNDRTIQSQYAYHYQFFNQIEVRIQEAWRIWDDEITKNYYEGDQKPEEPTPAFELDWIEEADLEADGFDLSWIEQLVGNSKNMTIEWFSYNEPGNKIIDRIGFDQDLNEVAWDYNCDRKDCDCVGGWVEGDESKVVHWRQK